MVSLKPGMFLPPTWIHRINPASVTFLPSENGRSYMPLRPGPIFGAEVSAKWQEAQCWRNRSLPNAVWSAAETVTTGFVFESFRGAWAEARTGDKTRTAVKDIKNTRPAEPPIVIGVFFLQRAAFNDSPEISWPLQSPLPQRA